MGYSTPLFLGGSDEASNLHVVDLDVYWSLTAQLLAKVRDLPPGANISGIHIE